MRWISRQLSRRQRLVLGGGPVLALLLLYLVAAALRHAANPADRILPLPGQMAAALWALAALPDPLSGRYLFWADTLASLWRLGVGLAIATAGAAVMGLVLGALPPVRATLGPLVLGVALIPPVALLPILFIVAGLGEAAKVALIVIGVAPVMIRDVAGHVEALPTEQIVKAQTLGASSWQVLIRVALPQALPRLFEAVRLALGPAFVFLISAEAIAADVGLGYRIFLVRRYLAMDVIIPYVIWIAALAILIDAVLVATARRLFAWSQPGRRP